MIYSHIKRLWRKFDSVYFKPATSRKISTQLNRSPCLWNPLSMFKLYRYMCLCSKNALQLTSVWTTSASCIVLHCHSLKEFWSSMVFYIRSWTHSYSVESSEHEDMDSWVSLQLCCDCMAVSHSRRDLIAKVRCPKDLRGKLQNSFSLRNICLQKHLFQFRFFQNTSTSSNWTALAAGCWPAQAPLWPQASSTPWCIFNLQTYSNKQQTYAKHM